MEYERPDSDFIEHPSHPDHDEYLHNKETEECMRDQEVDLQRAWQEGQLKAINHIFKALNLR